jgi:outer membrane protein assembly factor BamB
LYNSTVVIGNSNSLEFINATTGKKEDSINTSLNNITQVGDTLYAAGNYIISFDLSTREVQWAVDSSREVSSLIETDENALYVGARDGYLAAYDLTNGTKLWQTQAEHNIQSRPAAANGIVWAVDSVGNLSGFDSTTGENIFTGMDLLRPGEQAQVAALGSTVLLCVLYANDNVGQAYDIDVDALLE